MIDHISNKNKLHGVNSFHLGKRSTQNNTLGKYNNQSFTSSVMDLLPASIQKGIHKAQPFINIGKDMYDTYNNNVAKVHKGQENKENRESAEKTIRRKAVMEPTENVLVRNAVHPSEVRF